MYEIAYIVSKLAQCQENPTERHLLALKHLARYVSGCLDASLSYHVKSSAILDTYSDSDFAACPDTRRYRIGVAILYAGNLLYWTSTLQKSVKLSSAEAEYYAASEAARYVSWLRQLMNEWRLPKQPSTPLGVDNTCDLAMTVANGHTTKSKHIHTRERYVTEQFQSCAISVRYVPSNRQLADIFTKVLRRDKFYTILSLIYSSQYQLSGGDVTSTSHPVGIRIPTQPRERLL